MSDKERILMIIITRIIPRLVYGCHSYDDKEEYVKSYMLDRNGLEKGDLVFANSSIYPNDFMVGFIEELKDDCTVIREIGSSKLCNYYNESFTKINKDKLEDALKEEIAEKPKISKDVEIGFHQGALNTLVNERNEMIRVIAQIEQVMQAHIKRLEELGVKIKTSEKNNN